MKKTQISIVGTGYVGLCTAVGFTTKGYKVITSTSDPNKAEMINRGIPPFHEPELQKSLEKAVKEGNLRCVADREEAIMNTDITFITMATPAQQDGNINLRYIENSALKIGKALEKKKTYHLIVVKSTVIPGTTEKMVEPIIETHSNRNCVIDFGLCMNPEFLREGSAIYDTLNPDYIVIGEYDQKSGDVLETFYRDFYSEKMPPLIRTNLTTAELIKYANNAFLATKISFINTIANICQEIPNTDIAVVAKAIGMDRRISSLFLNAGLGYGGSCFPKDVKALITFSKNLSYDPQLLNAAENVNQNQPYKAIELCKSLLGDLKNKRVAILGLAFKPDTNDLREAVAVKMINRLLEEGATVTAYDPVAMPNARGVFQNKIEYASSVINCLKGADSCIVVTEWKEFQKLTPEDFVQNMRQPVLIDGRRIYNPMEYSRKLKFAATGLGR